MCICVCVSKISSVLHSRVCLVHTALEPIGEDTLASATSEDLRLHNEIKACTSPDNNVIKKSLFTSIVVVVVVNNVYILINK